MRRQMIGWLLGLTVIVGLAACGSSSSSSSGRASGSTGASSSTAASSASSSAASATPASGTVAISADPGGALRFQESSVSAKAGTVSIRFTNSASVPHNLTIQQGTSGPVLGATPTFAGGSHTLTVKLKPGHYTFFCSVPGHRAAGMQGVLIVH